jgi:hypothetical protein
MRIPTLFGSLLIVFLAAIPKTGFAEQPLGDDNFTKIRAELNEGYDHKLMEQKVLAIDPKKSKRKGKRLILFFENGKHQNYNDKTNCETFSDDCRVFLLEAYFPALHYFMIREYFYEGGDHILVDDRSGRESGLPGDQYYSPDGNRFFIKQESHVSWSDDNGEMQIWRRMGDGLELEWKGSISPLINVNTVDFVSWDTETEIIVEADNPQTFLPRRFLIRRQMDEWKIEADSPINHSNETWWVPDLSLVRLIEAGLALPPGARPFSEYTRYYAGKTQSGNRYLIGTFHLSGDSQAHFVDYYRPMDALGCDILDLKFDLDANKAIEFRCHGSKRFEP